MAENVTLEGVVVEPAGLDGQPLKTNEGLYLRTADGREWALIADHPAVQMPVDMVHRQSRAYFERFIGKVITISGFRSGSTLWNANVQIAPDGDRADGGNLLNPRLPENGK